MFAEPESQIAEALWEGADLLVSSQLIYPEARAAAAMAYRIERIDSSGLRDAVESIEALCAELRVIGVDESLARLAGELAEAHGLRGYDAVHLASAVSMEDARLVTATWDADLANAAVACGYAVVPA